MTLAIVLAGAVAVAALVIAEARSVQRLRWIAKPAASCLFLGLALHLGALDTGYGRLILAGLAACALGDVLLIEAGRGRFLGGMAAFAAGHAAYAAAFLGVGLAVEPAIAAVVAMAVAAGLTLRWLWAHLGAMRASVAGYGLIIGAMVAAAAGASGASADPRPIMGAGLFAVSDIAVARDRFVSLNWKNAAWGLPLYYLAQFILASTV